MVTVKSRSNRGLRDHRVRSSKGISSNAGKLADNVLNPTWAVSPLRYGSCQGKQFPRFNIIQYISDRKVFRDARDSTPCVWVADGNVIKPCPLKMSSHEGATNASFFARIRVGGRSLRSWTRWTVINILPGEGDWEWERGGEIEGNTRRILWGFAEAP